MDRTSGPNNVLRRGPPSRRRRASPCQSEFNAALDSTRNSGRALSPGAAVVYRPHRRSVAVVGSGGRATNVKRLKDLQLETPVCAGSFKFVEERRWGTTYFRLHAVERRLRKGHFSGPRSTGSRAFSHPVKRSETSPGRSCWTQW